MIIKYYKDYIESITEGLIKTHDGNKAIDELIRILETLNFNVSGEFKNERIELVINDFKHISKDKINDLFDLITSVITNQFGWFPSNMRMTNMNNQINRKPYNQDELILYQDIISSVKIEFESKFDDIDEDYSPKLYHISIQEYERNILKNGLVPKSKSKLATHLDRIYVCKSIDACHQLIPQMTLHYTDEKNHNLYTLQNKKWRKNTKWIIYEIDNTKNVKLYKDPRFVNGYYTMDNIPPKDITIVDREK